VQFGIAALPEVTRLPGGKPMFQNRQDISFNVSHSGGIALCGVGTRPLGVDVELVRPRRAGLSRRILSEGEQAQLAKAPDPVQRLIAFWALKESFVKYTGEGLRSPLREIAFEIDPSGGVSSNRTGCRFFLVEEAAFCAALCLDAKEETPQALFRVSMDQL
jgi:4'-phosphopantetheinyl transferase